MIYFYNFKVDDIKDFSDIKRARRACNSYYVAYWYCEHDFDDFEAFMEKLKTLKGVCCYKEFNESNTREYGRYVMIRPIKEFCGGRGRMPCVFGEHLENVVEK